MKQIILILTTILFLFSCEKKDTKSTSELQKNDSLSIDNQAIDTTATLFIALFPLIKPENLHIYSPEYEDDTINKFYGKEIPASFCKYLKFYENNDPSSETRCHYFSCFQFKMTDIKIGLIVRSPSKYTTSAIGLYTWDNAQKKVTDITYLADGYGDMGWHFSQNAWLKDLNNDKNIDVITRRKDFHQFLYDTTKIERSDSSFVFLNNGTTFKKTNFNLDTSKFQIKDWKEK